MASMLSLNDDCLYAIVSCLDDSRSFYSFALTCKRFLQVTKNTRNVLHSNNLRKKAEYCIKCFIVADRTSGKYRRKLDNLLQAAICFTATKGTLTYAKVVDQWQRNGSVAAKLLTWIRKIESSETTGIRVNDYSSVTLHLPNCNKSMVIDSVWDEFGHTEDLGGYFWKKLAIRVNCGDLDVKSVRCLKDSPKYYLHWDEEEVNSVVKPMKPAIELLQKELGDTIPPITGHFFIWLSCFFPGKVNLPEERRVSFKDTVKNTMPGPDAVQSAMDLCHQEGEAEFQSVVSEWKNDEEQKSKYSKTVVETIDLLVRRSETYFLVELQEGASKIYKLVSHHELKLLSKSFLLFLVLRTSLSIED